MVRLLSRYSNVICSSQKFYWRLLSFMCVSLFFNITEIYVIFGYFWAVRKVKLCFVIHHNIFMSFMNVEILLRRVLYCLWIFFNVSTILGIGVIFVHFKKLQKDVKFFSLIRHNILRSLVQVKKIKVLFVLFMCFFNFQSFSLCYEKK